MEMTNWKEVYESFKRINRLNDSDFAELFGTTANAMRNNSAMPKRIAALVLIIESGYQQAWTLCQTCGHRTPDFAPGEETCENCGLKF